MGIVVDVEISEVEAVVEVAVGDVADSMMTVEGTEIVIQVGVTEVVVQVVRAVILVDEFPALHNDVLPDQSHLESLALLPFVGIDHPLGVFLHLGTVVLVLALALLYRPTGDRLLHVGQVHPVDILRLLLLVLHHVTVGGDGHHLLLPLVTEIVVTKTAREVGAQLPDVVACLQRLHLILVVDPALLAASMLEGGV